MVRAPMADVALLTMYARGESLPLLQPVVRWSNLAAVLGADQKRGLLVTLAGVFAGPMEAGGAQLMGDAHYSAAAQVLREAAALADALAADPTAFPAAPEDAGGAGENN